MPHIHDPIPPGSVIGILGDGQLGRMLAIEAAKLGYKVAVLGPGGRKSSAGQVAYWAKAWGPKGEVSEELLDEFCGIVAVVTIEWENIPVTLLNRIVAKGIPVRPSAAVLEITQDRLKEKQFFEKIGVRAAPTLDIHDETSLAEAFDHIDALPFHFPAILKTRRDGYDGKGQIPVSSPTELKAAWGALKCVPCVLESRMQFKYEASTIVARSATGEMAPFPAVQNFHSAGILHTTFWPGAISGGVETKCQTAAVLLADRLEVVGLLAVEFFVMPNGEVLANEMAPRPHNSGHGTIEGNITSQFEQHIRAICGLPLGSPDPICKKWEMINILGEDANEWAGIIEQDRAIKFHDYGKGEVKPGRKMGHTTKIYMN